MTERMTIAQFRAAQAKTKTRKGPSREPGKRGNKYGAEKVVIDGIAFDSKREGNRYGELKNLERAGVIKDLELQPRIPLKGVSGPLRSDSGRELYYKGDFGYTETDTGKRVIEDAKGFKNKFYLLKKAILRSDGIEIVEV